MARFLLLAMITILGAAGGQREGDPARPAFRSDSRLVLVPVIVTDRRGATINGLDSKAFTILDNKTPQPILSFSEEDVPCSVGIVFDLSGSMKDRLADAKRALKLFFDLAGPEDEAFLVTVSDHPDLRSGFTNDFGSLLAGLTPERGGGSTALVDAIYHAVSAAKKAHNRRRALLVISDGMDNDSRYTHGELMSLAVEADVEIHTVAIFDPPAFKKPIQLREEKHGLLFLEEIANRTGGLHFMVRSDKEMRDAAARVGKALRSQYLVGFRPAAERDGRRHNMQIKLAMPDARAHARGHYLSE